MAGGIFWSSAVFVEALRKKMPCFFNVRLLNFCSSDTRVRDQHILKIWELL
jgi:hypothetical protein